MNTSRRAASLAGERLIEHGQLGGVEVQQRTRHQLGDTPAAAGEQLAARAEGTLEEPLDEIDGRVAHRAGRAGR